MGYWVSFLSWQYQQSLVIVSGFILDFLAIFFDIGTGGEDWDWEPGERGAGGEVVNGDV